MVQYRTVQEIMAPTVWLATAVVCVFTGVCFTIALFSLSNLSEKLDAIEIATVATGEIAQSNKSELANLTGRQPPVTKQALDETARRIDSKVAEYDRAIAEHDARLLAVESVSQDAIGATLQNTQKIKRVERSIVKPQKRRRTTKRRRRKTRSNLR